MQIKKMKIYILNDEKDLNNEKHVVVVLFNKKNIKNVFFELIF